jgi:hypothetical protein
MIMQNTHPAAQLAAKDAVDERGRLHLWWGLGVEWLQARLMHRI